MSIFGPIIDGHTIEGWATAHLELWLPTYIAEVARQRDVPIPPNPRSYVTVNEFDRWPEHQIPTCIVVSPGLADQPAKAGDGRYRATWVLGIAIIASGRDRPSTEKLSKMYAAAVRAAIAQHPSLGQSVVRGSQWRDERYTDVPNDDSRTLGSGQVYFYVEVDNVINTTGGPAGPPEDPEPPMDEWPVVGDVIITINKEELD